MRVFCSNAEFKSYLETLKNYQELFGYVLKLTVDTVVICSRILLRILKLLMFQIKYRYKIFIIEYVFNKQ